MTQRSYRLKTISLLLGFCTLAVATPCSAADLTVNIMNDDAGAGQCMDLSPNQKSITFTKCSNSNTQKWYIKTASGGFDFIKNSTLPNSLCFFSTLDGVGMHGCKSGTYSSQSYWNVIDSGNNQYSLRSKVQGDLGRSGWLSVKDNKPVLNVEKTATKKWHFVDTKVRKSTVIINSIAGENQCMDLAADKQKITFNSCNGSSTQQWFIDPTNGFNTIKNSTLGDRICLFSAKNGSSIDMRQCYSGYTSQIYWSVDLKTYGKYFIISKVQKDYGRNGKLGVKNKNLILNDTTTGIWSFSRDEPTERKMIGTFTVLLLNTHFTGAPQKSTEDIRKALFGGNGQYSSLREYLNLASRDTLTLKEGKTLDNLDIGDPGTSCNSLLYRKKAIDLARQRGVNPDSYDLIYVTHTAHSKCSYVANAVSASKFTMPGKYIVFNSSGHKYWAWSHEFGHTLGFRHSNILVNCPATPTGIKIDSSCRIGGSDGSGNDISDTMGGGGGRMYPVNYMYDVGWLTSKQFPVVGNGTYKIEPLLDHKGGNQGLRIARNNPDFPYLTLEFRQANRFDSSWPKDSPFINGVIVRQIRPKPLSSYNVIVHTVPGSSNRNTPPLMPGKTLYDTYSGKVITVDAIKSDGATVTISDYIAPVSQ